MSANKPTIGHGPEVHTRSFAGNPYANEGFGGFPGLGGGQSPFSDFQQGGGLPVPYEGGGGLFGGTPSTGSSNPLSGLNFNQIKGFIDRMGGIDGIIGTMGKVQKIVSSFQQMAPMLKLVFNSFGKGGSVKNADLDFGDALPRKRKRRKKSAGRRKSGRSSSARRR